MRPRHVVPWIVAAALVAPRVGFGQEVDGDEARVTVSGGVLDRSTGEVVRGALVVLSALGADDPQTWSGLTDESGNFESEPLPVGGFRLEVSADSFTPLVDALVLARPGAVDLGIEVVPVDFELEPIVAVGVRDNRLETQGFYSRRQSQGGTFLTREQIREENPLSVSDLFRTIPGARVSSNGSGLGSVVRLRMGCVPQVVMDGVPMAAPVQLDQVIGPNDLQAIEVHHGLTGPIRYAGENTCGQIMLWTRDPGESGQSIISLIRVLGAAAFVAIATLATR